jgi:hypothetical protein
MSVAVGVPAGDVVSDGAAGETASAAIAAAPRGASRRKMILRNMEIRRRIRARARVQRARFLRNHPS